MWYDGSMLKRGDTAPDFALPGNDGKEHRLHDYQGSWVLLYFYPKDNTPGCTTEAEMFRDVYTDFKKRGAVVLGVSTDSVASHERFAQKLELPFVLLADEARKVVDLYGVWGEKQFMGKTYTGVLRHSFLIRPDGTLAQVYTAVKPKTHPTEVLTDMDAAG